MKAKIKRSLNIINDWICDSKEMLLKKPNKEEAGLIELLRSRFSSLLQSPENGSVKNSWIQYRKKLSEYIKDKDPRNFLNWDIIRHSMFSPASVLELDYIKKLPDWESWKKTLTEDRMGNPKRYKLMKSSSGNLIHHTYSLAQVLKTFDLDIKNLSKIFEFGGGYGSMARLAFKKGFSGKYIIFDLVEFNFLQEYFLESLGIKTSVNNYSARSASVSLINDIHGLKEDVVKDTDLFLATWSLSEVPISVRNDVLGAVKNPRYYLIAYQEKFEDIDNTGYFKDLRNRLTDYDWHNYPIEHLPGNYYLLGKKKI